MGAEATADFYQRLVRSTPAEKDQDHLYVIIEGNSKIPDRTTSIQNNSPATRDAVIESAERLEQMGADFLVMPCNSAHYWYHEIQDSVGIPLLNMVYEVMGAVRHSGVKSVGVFATKGTISSGIYSDESGDVEIIIPEEEELELIHSSIYTVKGNTGMSREEAKATVFGVLDNLRQRGIEGLILGCTEIPLLISQADVEDMPVFDSTDILVEATLREALPVEQPPDP